MNRAHGVDGPHCCVVVGQNGSSIRPWWIHHHYISAMIAVVMLTWPITDTYRSFMKLFNVRWGLV